jgi:hypothetical protein
MSTTTPPAVWPNKFSEGFRVELSGGAATYALEHKKESFPAAIIGDDGEAHQFEVLVSAARLAREC